MDLEICKRKLIEELLAHEKDKLKKSCAYQIDRIISKSLDAGKSTRFLVQDRLFSKPVFLSPQKSSCPPRISAVHFPSNSSSVIGVPSV